MAVFLCSEVTGMPDFLVSSKIPSPAKHQRAFVEPSLGNLPVSGFPTDTAWTSRAGCTGLQRVARQASLFGHCLYLVAQTSFGSGQNRQLA